MDPLQSIIAYKASCAGRMQHGCMLGNCNVCVRASVLSQKRCYLTGAQEGIEARLRCDAIDAGIY